MLKLTLKIDFGVGVYVDHDGAAAEDDVDDYVDVDVDVDVEVDD